MLNRFLLSDIFASLISTTKKIQKHLNSDTTDDLQGEFVTAYCSLFKCSADYIFGFIPLENHEDSDIFILTGLNDDAISTLKSLNMNNGSTVSGHNEIETLT